MSQMELADQLFTYQSTISNWEIGRNHVSDAFFELLPKVLECTLHDLEESDGYDIHVRNVAEYRMLLAMLAAHREAMIEEGR